MSYDSKANANAFGLFASAPPPVRSPGFDFQVNEGSATTLNGGEVIAQVNMPPDMWFRRFWFTRLMQTGTPNFEARIEWLLNNQLVGTMPFINRGSGNAPLLNLNVVSTATSSAQNAILHIFGGSTAVNTVAAQEVVVTADTCRVRIVRGSPATGIVLQGFLAVLSQNVK